jgi:hypothetical protein
LGVFPPHLYVGKFFERIMVGVMVGVQV